MKLSLNISNGTDNLLLYIKSIDNSEVEHLILNIVPGNYSYNLKDFSNVNLPKLKKITVGNNMNMKEPLLHNIRYLELLDLDRVTIYGIDYDPTNITYTPLLPTKELLINCIGSYKYKFTNSFFTYHDNYYTISYKLAILYKLNWKTLKKYGLFVCDNCNSICHKVGYEYYKTNICPHCRYEDLDFMKCPRCDIVQCIKANGMSNWCKFCWLPIKRYSNGRISITIQNHGNVQLEFDSCVVCKKLYDPIRYQDKTDRDIICQDCNNHRLIIECPFCHIMRSHDGEETVSICRLCSIKTKHYEDGTFDVIDEKQIVLY